jgi:hypothetical protein
MRFHSTKEAWADHPREATGVLRIVRRRVYSIPIEGAFVEDAVLHDVKHVERVTHVEVTGTRVSGNAFQALGIKARRHDRRLLVFSLRSIAREAAPRTLWYSKRIEWPYGPAIDGCKAQRHDVPSC